MQLYLDSFQSCYCCRHVWEKLDSLQSIFFSTITIFPTYMYIRTTYKTWCFSCVLYFQRLLEDMTLEEHRQLTSELLQQQPGLIFDAFMMHQCRRGVPFAGVPGVPWCTCGNCRDMPTDREKKMLWPGPCKLCEPYSTLLPVLPEEGFLRIHRQYREDITVLGQTREPGDDNREYRYAAYRHFIYWQHGSLGQGNRLVIPSCCVWRIRDKFPDPQGQYTGFTPGLWVSFLALWNVHTVSLYSHTCLFIIKASNHPLFICYIFYILFIIIFAL